MSFHKIGEFVSPWLVRLAGNLARPTPTNLAFRLNCCAGTALNSSCLAVLDDADKCAGTALNSSCLAVLDDADKADK